jgi:hypothetical protein
MRQVCVCTLLDLKYNQHTLIRFRIRPAKWYSSAMPLGSQVCDMEKCTVGPTEPLTTRTGEHST